ncbi:hypothetical protein N8500_11065, partial [Candidatus Puniceispirillum sp.]|nr:hypothetical protein [Candidatus Puniceispirillum sp.]
MNKPLKKIEKNWTALLLQRSKNYLVRSKLDQNITITQSNLSASFMGNRQLANHNTADIRFNLNKIAEYNLQGDNLERENIELTFLKHQQKLNKKLLENSEQLVNALEQLQSAHKRVMKTNEDIIKFNTGLIESTVKVIQEGELPHEMQLSEENMKIELDKIEKTITATDKKIEKQIARVEEISKENGKLSSELNLKREKITEN